MKSPDWFLLKLPKKVINGVFNRLQKRFFPTPYEITAKKWFAAKGDDTLRQEFPLTRNSLVLDVGGYTGQWASDIFARYCCQIQVFEPVPEFADKITGRFKENPSIRVFNFGLSGKTCESEISVNADSSSHTREFPQKTKIKLKNISEWLKENTIEHIDLIKINIEGGEYELLESLFDSNQIPKIRFLLIQFHDFVPDAASKREQLRKQLEKTHILLWDYPFVWECWEKKS